MEEVKRVCVLTGASGRLGQAFIEAYASRYLIVGVYHNKHLENDVVRSIRADLTQSEDIEMLCRTVIDRFQRVDLLINAAVYSRWSRVLVPGALSEAERSFNVNVIAPLRLAVGFANVFWSGRKEENIDRNRNIINISSTSGTRIYPNSGQIIYSATKAALNYASSHLANEFNDIGVRVNAIAPTTFPHIVTTESVLEAIITLNECRTTGGLVIIDKN